MKNPVKKARNLLSDVQDTILEWEEFGIHGEIYLKYVGQVGYDEDMEGSLGLPVIEGVKVDYGLERGKDQDSDFTLIIKVKT